MPVTPADVHGNVGGEDGAEGAVLEGVAHVADHGAQGMDAGGRMVFAQVRDAIARLPRRGEHDDRHENGEQEREAGVGLRVELPIWILGRSAEEDEQDERARDGAANAIPDAALHDDVGAFVVVVADLGPEREVGHVIHREAELQQCVSHHEPEE